MSSSFIGPRPYVSYLEKKELILSRTVVSLSMSYTVLYTYSLIKILGSNESKHYESEIKKGLIDQTKNITVKLRIVSLLLGRPLDVYWNTDYVPFIYFMVLFSFIDSKTKNTAV